MTLPLLLAFTTTALALALLRRSPLGRHMGDVPNERSLHQHVIPRIGGMGMLAGLAAAWSALPGGTPALTWATMGYLVLFAVSIADDVRSLPVIVRLAVHLAVAAGWCWAIGGPAWTLVVGFFMVVWSINLYNFMDGSDGLAGGMTAIGFTTYALAAFLGGDTVTAAFCGAVAAAALAFLLFNFHPASLFLGDSGSVPLGYLAAVIGWYGISRGLWPLALPVLAFFPFLFDATYTLVRRALRGERVWRAHREHLYQRAIRSGSEHRTVALATYALMFCTAVLALVTRSLRDHASVLIILAAIAAGLFLARVVDRRYLARRVVE